LSETDEQLRERICVQAADWFVANRADPSEQEQAEFAAWLRADPAHLDEYQRIASVSSDLREACRRPDGSIEEIVERARTDARVLPFPRLVSNRVSDTRVSATGTARWPRTAATLAAVAAVSVTGLYLTRDRWLADLPHRSDSITTLHFETRHGEQQTVVLADNSILHLNTDSAATVRYAESSRSLTLTTGEVHLQVTHDLKRPFHVLAGAADIVDVGTQFDVRLQQDATRVTVIEGRVAVGLSADGHAPAHRLELAANQQVTVTASNLPVTPTLVDAQHTTAWLDRQIVFEREALVDVAEEFNRYSLKPIEIVSPSLQPMQISGMFALEDTDSFVAFLRSLDGVRVDVTPTRIRVARH
jgi:transmembrane sensor